MCIFLRSCPFLLEEFRDSSAGISRRVLCGWLLEGCAAFGAGITPFSDLPGDPDGAAGRTTFTNGYISLSVCYTSALTQKRARAAAILFIGTH